MILHRVASSLLATLNRPEPLTPLGFYALDENDRWIFVEGKDELFDDLFSTFTEWSSEEDKGFDDL
ncbi:MAG: hypothetical protein EON57_11435 [Alphaproteobacteria bacterium]|nr:MAG: hypothetical protein EON57_11435 [Alphaproteobacteria bacterium]